MEARQNAQRLTPASAPRMLEALCAVDSTSGCEARILPVLVPMLESLGAEVRVAEVAADRCNVLALWGEPRVAFSTHLDTVPPFIAPQWRAEGLHGRGACDAKGQIVAQVLAIQDLLEAGHHGFAWLGVCGEETDSLGALRALDWKGHFRSCRVLVNGEPTELRCATGQRGALHLRLCCEGRAAHSGSPELGHSATLDLLDWIQALRESPNPEDPELGPEVWNLGLLRGGCAPNVIPEAAEADLLVRTVPATRFLEAARGARPAQGRLEVLLDEPWDTYPILPGFPMAPMPFGSDAPQLRDLIPDRTVVLAGPGSIRVAHTPDEYLAWSDLTQGIELNRRIALHFLENTPCS